MRRGWRECRAVGGEEAHTPLCAASAGACPPVSTAGGPTAPTALPTRPAAGRATRRFRLAMALRRAYGSEVTISSQAAREFGTS